MTSLPSFEEFFKELWGYGPFPWQEMLAKRVASGTWPSALDLPTASGKTACMDAAVWALACQADRQVSARTAPRRVWFVVDRRIVVDEAHDRATTIARKLKEATKGPLRAVADRLLVVGGTTRPLAVARLRGGVLRDDGWARLPSQAAVITSTVDQIGSRLLFRGYGRSHLTAPIFAGLAAHDSLILLDEAHCSVPFLQTLRSIEHFRGGDWAEEPIKTPFAFVSFSATPPSDIPASSLFPGQARKQALDHPVLRQRTEASKLAQLVPPLPHSGSAVDPLVLEAAQRAQAYVEKEGKQRVAVIVNRVRTAIEIWHRLREQLADTADAVLLTGRLRPFERDRLVERWKPFLKASDPSTPEKPIVLVSTQCLEVGADFSFEALVTEAASLDALRQRFGRLNRMGRPGLAPAAVLIRQEDCAAEREDPIYGEAIAETWQLLQDKATASEATVIDFGIDALNESLADVEDLAVFSAPTLAAPTLLPAHVDLLCQTAPLPRPDPDIQLFLHGVGRGSPEARIVWRADLAEHATGVWEEAVALCAPVSGEALSVPLHHLRQWLAGSVELRDEGDVEGAAAHRADSPGQIRPVLVWAGRDHSRVVRRGSDIRPNDLVVVPAHYGMLPMGQSEPHEALGRAQLDLWEPARIASGQPPALRLHRAVLEPWIQSPPVEALVELAADAASDRSGLRDALDAVLAYEQEGRDDPTAIPGWLRSVVRELGSARVEEHPGGGLVLLGRARRGEPGPEDDMFADDDDLLSATGQEVTLSVHSESVRRAVQQIAERCLDPKLLQPLQAAAYWHDVGKLDERFQVLLQQGDELAAVASTPLAKSKGVPLSPARRAAIRQASGLPRGFRHEMLSLQLAERHAPLPASEDDAALILHLVASHHGHARPFGPVCSDPAPPDVVGTHGGIQVGLRSEERGTLCPPCSASSMVAARFWGLTRRHGWWGVAYLEAVLRLADWYGSVHVVDDARAAASSATTATRRRLLARQSADEPLALPGLDGGNPLGFLAAVGTLAVLHEAGQQGVKLHWERGATWQAYISGMEVGAGEGGPSESVVRILSMALRGKEVPKKAEGKRREAQKRYEAAKKAVKKKRDEIKRLGLRGKERKELVEAEVRPLEATVDARRHERQEALRAAVPRLELTIGKHLDCTIEEYREHAAGFLSAVDGGSSRGPIDFLAAFASDGVLHESDGKRAKGILAPTPFCFTSGSGHQYFLDTVRQLMANVDEGRLRATLFEPWRYRDEKLSMRWDPSEDRRYALMDRDREHPSKVGTSRGAALGLRMGGAAVG